MAKRSVQRDLMRSLYAKAERDGRIVRRSNVQNKTPEQYASALFADGIAKGWISEGDRRAN